jgi:hypothetical protein
MNSSGFEFRNISKLMSAYPFAYSIVNVIGILVNPED